MELDGDRDFMHQRSPCPSFLWDRESVNSGVVPTVTFFFFLIFPALTFHSHEEELIIFSLES
jgi:hypothetical protein